MICSMISGDDLSLGFISLGARDCRYVGFSLLLRSILAKGLIDSTFHVSRGSSTMARKHVNSFAPHSLTKRPCASIRPFEAFTVMVREMSL